MEKGLLQSLSILAEAHSFIPLDTKDKAYPYNILLSHWHAEHQLTDANSNMRLAMVADDNGHASFMATETVDTCSTLYYIPILPLYRMLEDRQTRKAGDLLLSVCSYLCRMAGIPYYRDEDSYLYWHYEMLRDSLECDNEGMDAADYLSYKSGFDQAAYFGDVMGRRLYSRYHLEHFAGQISRFKPCNDTDAACLKIAKAAYDLWQSCPDSNLYGHIPAGIDDDENEEPPIRIYEYVSFIADTKGQLYESLSDCINSEFNEKSGIDEPLVKKVYNRSYDPTGSLEFEYRLFDLLNDLAGLLNDMP